MPPASSPHHRQPLNNSAASQSRQESKHIQRVSQFPSPFLRDSMTPTPPSHSSFQDGLRFAGRRRLRPANPYDTHHTPPNPHPHSPVTPLPDRGIEVEELSDDDEDAEDEDDVDDIDGEDEGIEGEENDVDADEEEGGIEEGALCD